MTAIPHMTTTKPPSKLLPYLRSHWLVLSHKHIGHSPNELNNNLIKNYEKQHAKSNFLVSVSYLRKYEKNIVVSMARYDGDALCGINYVTQSSR